MGNKKLILLKWNKESVFADAKRYRTKSELEKASPGAYAEARRLSILDPAAEHVVYKSSATPY